MLNAYSRTVTDMEGAGAPSSPARLGSLGAERARVLFVLASLAVGGSETKTVRIVNSMRTHGISAAIAYLNGPNDLRASVAKGVPVWHLGRRGKVSWEAIRTLRSLVREYKPTVLVAVNLYPALYVTLACLGLPVRPRTVGLINTSEFTREHAWRASFYRPVMKRLDRTVYGSQLQREHWQSLLRYPSERSLVLYNGVDTRYFAPDESGAMRERERRRLGVTPRSFVIGAVGRLAPEKNQVALIEAAAQLRRDGVDSHLLLVGDGALRAELEQRAAQLGVRERVIFAGKLSDVRPALEAMDVFVLPSTHVETFSNAALEAMSMAKPVILSDIGGAAEMVRDGVDGYTLARAELAEKLTPLLARLHADPQLQRNVGRAARERVLKDFSHDHMVESYAALMRELRGER